MGYLDTTVPPNIYLRSGRPSVRAMANGFDIVIRFGHGTQLPASAAAGLSDRRITGVPAASLRKFTLAYCTQDQPLSSAVRVAAQRTPTPRSLAEECSCRKHEESSACKGPFNRNVRPTARCDLGNYLRDFLGRYSAPQCQNPTRARRVIDLKRLNSRMNSLKPLDGSNPCLTMTFFKLIGISTKTA